MTSKTQPRIETIQSSQDVEIINNKICMDKETFKWLYREAMRGVNCKE